MNYTKKIADFVVETIYGAIPPKALEVAKVAVLDCLGVTLAGSKEPSARICAELVREERSKGDATVIGQGFKSSALMAAFANGTAAHALDYDHSALLGQPTAGLIPSIFPLAETLKRNGRELLEAYVLGFEITVKLARSMPVLSSQGSWRNKRAILGQEVLWKRVLWLQL